MNAFSVYKLPHPLKSLTRILDAITPEVTIGDMKAAANQLTVSFETIVEYVHGNCLDIELTERLIAFLKRRIDARNE